MELNEIIGLDGASETSMEHLRKRQITPVLLGHEHPLVDHGSEVVIDGSH